jgi:hypothetical protein
VAFAAADRLRPGERIYPRDLRFFWRALEAAGVGEDPTFPRLSAEEVKRSIHERVGAIVASLNPPALVY